MSAVSFSTKVLFMALWTRSWVLNFHSKILNVQRILLKDLWYTWHDNSWESHKNSSLSVSLPLVRSDQSLISRSHKKLAYWQLSLSLLRDWFARQLNFQGLSYDLGDCTKWEYMFPNTDKPLLQIPDNLNFIFLFQGLSYDLGDCTKWEYMFPNTDKPLLQIPDNLNFIFLF